MESLLIIGCGAHGRVVAETALEGGRYRVLGFADDAVAQHGKRVGEWKVLGDWREIAADAHVVAIGNNAGRQKVYEQLVAAGRALATVVSARAHVSARATVGAGTVILSGAIVQSQAVVGVNCLIAPGAVLDHDASVGDHAHIGANAVVHSFAIVQPGELLPPLTLRPRPSAK